MARLVLLISLRKLMLMAATLTILSLIVFLIRLGSTGSVPNSLLTTDQLTGKKIVIDPGHGGIDGGTNCPGFLEKEVNLAVAKKLEDELTARGAVVTLTRETDIDLGQMSPEDGNGRYLRGLKTRVSIIEQNQTDLFLSIHVNANQRRPSTSGPMVFYSRKVSSSQVLADTVQARLNTFAEGKGVKQHNAEPARFYLLENCKNTGVIVELGFMTNQYERELLKQDDYQRELAQVLVEGLKDYFTQSESLKGTLR